MESCISHPEVHRYQAVHDGQTRNLNPNAFSRIIVPDKLPQIITNKVTESMERIKTLLSQFKQLVLNGYNMFQENRMSIYSGYATLFIVTAIFPCIVLIISIVNLLPGYSTKDVADVLLQILPDLGPIKELVISIMGNLKDQSGGLLASAAAITTLWSASKGVSAIQKGLNELDEPEQRLDTPEEDSEPKEEKDN